MAVVPNVENVLGSAEFAALTTMVARLEAKRSRNRIRRHYYDATNDLKDLGIAIPPRLRDVEVAMGWPARGVDLLSRRVRLEEFVLPGGDPADYGIDVIWRDNRLDTTVQMAQTSALISSVAFILTYLGDPSVGEPEVVVTPVDAEHATGLWHPAAGRLGAGLVDFTPLDAPDRVRYLALFPDRIHTIWCEDGAWHVRTVRNGLGRVPLEPLVYRPRLDRPFGSSRISRAVMNITDAAMRTVLRSEVGAEFFSAPQRYLLGADEEMFTRADGSRASTWDLLMGRMLALPRDENTEALPQVGQFPQISMQPHTDHLMMWARLFSAETGIPVDQLGIVSDNPASAEAMYAATQALIIEAEASARGFNPAWVNAMIAAVQMRENLAEVPDALRALSGRWADPSTPSRASAVDAVVKEIGAGLLPADSEVALERAGYSEVDIRRIVADRRRAAGRTALDSIMARLAQTPPTTETASTEATETPTEPTEEV